MILLIIGIVCFCVAVYAFFIGTTLAYVLCGVSVFVALLMFLNSYRLFKEKKENRIIALKAEKQLVRFISDNCFKPDGSPIIDFNRPFMLFDSSSQKIFCGMPIGECALIPYSLLLGVRIYGRQKIIGETESFTDYLAEIMPESTDSQGDLCMPESRGLVFMFLLNNAEEPLYEFEYVDHEFPTNSSYYRDAVKRAKAYLVQVQDIAERETEEYDAEVVYWEFEE